MRRCEDGALIDVEVSIGPIRDRTGLIVGASKIARDNGKLVASRLSERRLTRLMHALTQASRATSRPTSDQELFAELCRICVDLGGASSCWLIEGDGDTLNLKACAGLSEASARSITTLLFRKPEASRSLAQGESVVITGVTGWPAAEPNDAAMPAAAVTVAGLPFKRNGAVSGTLAVVSSDPGFFDAAAMDVLRELAADLSNALTSRARDLERASSSRPWMRSSRSMPTTASSASTSPPRTSFFGRGTRRWASRSSASFRIAFAPRTGS